MSALSVAVPDASECARCGTTVHEDGDGEYRRRFRLEDAAESTYGETSGKLCFECWFAVQEFIGGDQ